jgi:ankyrin repeat protein
MAAHHGKYDVVKALIQKGANVNITTDNGWTPLMAAANQGHLTIMQALLDKNADTKQTNGDGMTVFDIIESKDSNEVKVRLLELVQKYRT